MLNLRMKEARGVPVKLHKPYVGEAVKT
jgi:hypothetical protein